MAVTTPSSRLWLWVLAAASGGAALSLQARINADLGTHVGDALVAATVSFAVGLVILGVAMIAPRNRTGFGLVVRSFRTRETPWWAVVMGLVGACVVGSQAFAAGPLGVALYTVGFVAGQISSGLVLDRIGVLGTPKRAITVPRVAGAALGLVGVLIGFLGSGGEVRLPLLVLVAVVVGMFLPLQQLLQGHFARVAGSPITSAFINFAIGLVILLVAMAAAGSFGRLGQLPTEPWLYLGGVIGAGFVALSSLVVQRLGVLLMGLSLIAGQVIGALFINLLVPSGTEVTGWTVVAAAFTLLSIGVTFGPSIVARRRGGGAAA